MAPKSRVWSEADEITILTRLADHLDEHGSIPTASTLYGSIRSSLEFRGELQKTQLGDKIRRLKRKYRAAQQAVGKATLKPHDQTLYDLSSKVWKEEVGSTASGSAGKKKKKKKTDGAEEEEEYDKPEEGDARRDEDSAAELVKKKGGTANSYPFLTGFIYHNKVRTFTDSVERDLESVDPSKALALEQKCKELCLMAAHTHLRQLAHIKKAVKLTLKEFEGSM